MKRGHPRQIVFGVRINCQCGEDGREKILLVIRLLDHVHAVHVGCAGHDAPLQAAACHHHAPRDHYPHAWSMMMTGCGLKRGIVTGATDVGGVDVIEKPYNEQNLLATICAAIAIAHYAEYDLPGL